MVKVKMTNNTKCGQLCELKKMLCIANDRLNRFYHFGKVWQYHWDWTCTTLFYSSLSTKLKYEHIYQKAGTKMSKEYSMK